ncbi:hypothetical protein D3C75_1354460 [compost metagenome]
MTFLPFSAASIRAATMGLSLEVRYRVCLMAMTLGSRAACRRNWTTTSKLSNGWWISMSFSRTAAKMSPPLSRTRSG